MVNSITVDCEIETVTRESTVSVHETAMLSETTGVGANTYAQSSDPVCEFYTDHPYPPPVENLDRARDEWRDENRPHDRKRW